MPEGSTDLPHYARDRFGKRYVLLDPEEPSVGAVKRIYRMLLDDIVENLSGVRRGAEGLYLHDFRVATRRTRTGLRQLRGVHPEDVARHFAAEFGWITRESNDARDLEVYLESLPRYRESLAPATFQGMSGFFDDIRAHTAAHRAASAAAVNSERFELLLGEWGRFLAATNGAPQPPNAARPIRDIAGARIQAAYDRVARHGGAIHEDSPGHAFHRLRLQCKKLRYLLEFFRGLFDAEQGDDAVESLRAIQDDLGYLNDLRVQARWLLRFVAPDLAPEVSINAAVRLLADDVPHAPADTLRYIEDERREVRARFLRDFACFIAADRRAAFARFLTSCPALRER